MHVTRCQCLCLAGNWWGPWYVLGGVYDGSSRVHLGSAVLCLAMLVPPMAEQQPCILLPPPFPHR